MIKLIYVLGKSCSGKDTVCKEVLKHYENEGKPLKELIIYTTRRMREGEVQGETYNFVTQEELDNLKDHPDYHFIESRTYDTMYGKWTYATIVHEDIFKDDSVYINIGTLESLEKVQYTFGGNNILPIYLNTTPDVLMQRAIDRITDKYYVPAYLEACRRFIQDEEDFSPLKLSKIGTYHRVVSSDVTEETVGDVVYTIDRFL